MFQRLFLNLAADLCFCLGGLLLLPVPVEAGPAYIAQLAHLTSVRLKVEQNQLLGDVY